MLQGVLFLEASQLFAVLLLKKKTKHIEVKPDPDSRPVKLRWRNSLCRGASKLQDALFYFTPSLLVIHGSILGHTGTELSL